MNGRQLIEEATTIYWERIRRQKQDGTVVYQQPNKKRSSVEMVDGVPVVTLRNVSGFLATIKLTPRLRRRVASLRAEEDEFLRQLGQLS